MDRRLRWLPALLVALVVLAASVTSGAPQGPELGPFGLVGFDKYLHALAYVALGGTLGFALGSEQTWFAVLLAVGVATVYGGAIEVVQAFVGRDASFADLAADAFGAVVGALLAAALEPWLAKLRPNGEPER